jgi:hypothetical protein
MNVGRTWSESYQPLFAGSVDEANFVSWLRWAWNTQTVFTIKHLLTPGSGIAPNGTGTGGITVDGAAQTGNTLDTTGWPLSTSNVVRAGDLIKVAGIGYTFEVTDDANSDGAGDATVGINPPIYTAPADAAAVTTTDVDISAIITQISIPEISNAFYYDGISIGIRESP